MALASTDGGAVKTGAALLVALFGLCEAAAIAAVLRFRGADWLLLGLIHLGTLVLLAWYAWSQTSRDDCTTAVIGLLGAAAVGPLGAVGAGLVGYLTRRPTHSAEVLDAWYERISLATAVDPIKQLSDHIGVGRAIDLGADAPSSFATVIETGTLAERQALLGLVARHFHLDFLSVLRAALASPEAVIRVQAAAVAAHVRPEVARLFRATYDEASHEGSPLERVLVLLHDVEMLTESGLLDESDRVRGLALAMRLGDRILAAIFLSEAHALRVARTSEAGGAMIERLLLERGRFAELRAWRSSCRATRKRLTTRIRRLRIKPIARPPTSEAAA